MKKPVLIWAILIQVWALKALPAVKLSKKAVIKENNIKLLTIHEMQSQRRMKILCYAPKTAERVWLNLGDDHPDC